MKRSKKGAIAAFLFFAAFLLLSPSVRSQSLEETRKIAADLMKQEKHLEALPHLEKIAEADPENAEIQYQLGFALISKAVATSNPADRRVIRIQAREALSKARKLGIDTPLIDGLISSIAPDGSERGKFSFNKEAESLMREAEASFAKRDLDDALEKYQRALENDPDLYYAALFTGDVFMHKQEYDQAEIWYRKAIAINPNIETAYRYSATPLMKQGKHKEALPRYIEAYITDPYSKFAISGLTQWGQVTKTRLGHPKMDIPEFTIGEDGKAKSTISLSSVMDDGSIAWIAYTATRSLWYEKKFKETFPKASEYRHTLLEEADALKSVINLAKESKDKKKKLNPQIETLIKLDSEGLLESYILLAIADRGIAQDHFAYMKNNREKLRQYVMNYVIQK